MGTRMMIFCNHIYIFLLLCCTFFNLFFLLFVLNYLLRICPFHVLITVLMNYFPTKYYLFFVVFVYLISFLLLLYYLCVCWYFTVIWCSYFELYSIFFFLV